MPHDVFISHDPVDREIADAVVGAIEGSGSACWIAHRDRPSRAPTDESIGLAVQESRILILFLTASNPDAGWPPRPVYRRGASPFGGG
jgi:hypothetical protein